MLENIVKFIVVLWLAITFADIATYFRVANIQFDQDKSIKKQISGYNVISLVVVGFILCWLVFEFNILEKL